MVNSNSKLQKSVFCLSFSLSLSLSLSKLFGLVFWFLSPLRGLCFEGMVLFGFGSVLFWKLEKGLFVGIFCLLLGREEISRERERWDCFWRHGGKDWRESERERERENSVLVIRSFQDGWGELMKSMLL